MQINNNIIINRNSLNVLFHEIPDDYMSNNIEIGRQVFRDTLQWSLVTELK